MSSNPTRVPLSVVNGFGGRAAPDADVGPFRHRGHARAWHGSAAVAAVAALVAAAAVNGSGEPSPGRIVAGGQGYNVYQQDFSDEVDTVKHGTAASSAHGYAPTGVADCISIGLLGVRWPEGESNPPATTGHLVSHTSSAIAGSADRVDSVGQTVSRIDAQLRPVTAVGTHTMKVRDVC